MVPTTTAAASFVFRVAALFLLCPLCVNAQQTDRADSERANAASQRAPITRDDALLAFDPDGQTVELNVAGGPTVSALLNPPQGGAPIGTVLLLPGDRRPYSGSAAEQLYHLMPKHRWQVLILPFAALPSIRFGQLFPHASQAAQPDTTPASNSEEFARSGPEPPRTFSEWSFDALDRVNAAIVALADLGAGGIWLIGEGYGAQIAAQLLETDPPPMVRGVIFINARIPPDLVGAWPSNPDLPAIDLFDPHVATPYTDRRRQLASAAMTKDYAQLRVAQSGPVAFGQDSLISRRVRGWLNRQTSSG